jgi:hypothetical protein
MYESLLRILKALTSIKISHRKVHSMALCLNINDNKLNINFQGHLKMAFILKNTEFTTIHAKGFDDQGSEVASAQFNWVSSDPSILALSAGDDSKSVRATTTGTPGNVTITVSCGSASAAFDIAVTTGEVVTITLTADTPTSRL